jgi:hypothetical protein
MAKRLRKRFPHGYLDVMALALLAYDHTLSNAEIADILGCNPRSLAPSCCPKLQSMRATIAAERRDYHGGRSRSDRARRG